LLMDYFVITGVGPKIKSPILWNKNYYGE